MDAEGSLAWRAGWEQPGTAPCSASLGMGKQKVFPTFPTGIWTFLSAAVHAIKLDKSIETLILEKEKKKIKKSPFFVCVS